LSCVFNLIERLVYRDMVFGRLKRVRKGTNIVADAEFPRQKKRLKMLSFPESFSLVYSFGGAIERTL